MQRTSRTGGYAQPNAANIQNWWLCTAKCSEHPELLAVYSQMQQTSRTGGYAQPNAANNHNWWLCTAKCSEQTELLAK
jgi:hypothetical protein